MWLKHMTTYERVKPATAGPPGPVVGTYLELKMLCLFYFALESDKNGNNVGTAVEPEKRFYRPPFYSFFYILFLFVNVNCISQYMNAIATNNDLLMDYYILPICLIDFDHQDG